MAFIMLCDYYIRKEFEQSLEEFHLDYEYIKPIIHQKFNAEVCAIIIDVNNPINSSMHTVVINTLSEQMSQPTVYFSTQTAQNGQLFNVFFLIFKLAFEFSKCKWNRSQFKFIVADTDNNLQRN